MPATSVTFEAYHYDAGASELAPRVRSERQDVTFTLHGDSVTVILPPPAACVLYLEVSPQRFAETLARAMTPTDPKGTECKDD